MLKNCGIVPKVKQLSGLVSFSYEIKLNIKICSRKQLTHLKHGSANYN